MIRTHIYAYVAAVGESSVSASTAVDIEQVQQLQEELEQLLPA